MRKAATPPLRALWFGMAVGLLVLAIAVVLGARLDFHHDPNYAGTPVTPPKFAADALLTDQNGRPAHLFEPGVSVTYLFFGYTHCPDECPLAMASLGRAYRALTPAQRAKTRIVFVTVDPSRDTPAVMKRYVDAFDANVTGLTGNRHDLEAAWRDYGVTIDATTKDIAHGDAIYAIDATQHAVLIYPPTAAAKDLAGDAAKMIQN